MLKLRRFYCRLALQNVLLKLAYIRIGDLSTCEHKTVLNSGSDGRASNTTG